MNVLDENIIESQRQLLRSWRIRHKQIGQDVGHKGMKDREQIIPLLQSMVGPVLFTCDMQLYNRRLCHQRYTIVSLAIAASEVAVFIRRFLRHPGFNTKGKRAGKVIRLSKSGIQFWQVNAESEKQVAW